MRLATFNVLHGRAVSDGRVDIDRLRAAVGALDVDVLGLQEVDRAQPRSGRHDLTAVAAAALDAPEYRFAPALVGTPGQRWRPATRRDDGRTTVAAYGVGLVSRLPVHRWVVIPLPAAPVRSPVLLPAPPGAAVPATAPAAMPGPRVGRVVWLRDEPRVLLAAVLAGPAGPMTVATTHLSFVPGWNGVQLRRVVRALRRLPAPRVLLGDLNLPWALPRLLTGWRMLAAVPTYPAADPHVQLDHVLAHGDLRRLGPVRSARALTTALSDHCALVVDLGDPRPAGR